MQHEIKTDFESHPLPLDRDPWIMLLLLERRRDAGRDCSEYLPAFYNLIAALPRREQRPLIEAGARIFGYEIADAIEAVDLALLARMARSARSSMAQ